jgi:hypothetical protein
MTLKIVYESERRLGRAKLISLLDAVRNDFRSMREVWNNFRQTIRPDTTKGLPDIRPLSSVLIESLRTKGQLAIDDTWLGTSSLTMEQASSLLGAHGGLNLGCTYFEKCTDYAEPRDGGDWIGFRLEPGKTFFGYDANGSRVCLDRDYRRAVLGDVIRRFGLPLLLKEAKGHDFLEHKSSGRLEITRGGSGDEDPCGFFCEVGEINYREYLEKIDGFINEYASGRLESSWGLFSETDLQHRTEPSRPVYEALRKAPLPAKSYSIIMVFFLRSLDGTEQIGPLLKKDDEVEIQLCGFIVDKMRYGLSVLVGRQGSRLRVHSNSKADKKDFSASPVAKKLAAFL